VGTYGLLQAACTVWLDSTDAPRSHRFHRVSTDEVYGSLGLSGPGFTESTPYAPNSPYSASKAAFDHLVRAYHTTYGLKITTSNCSNGYGPYQVPEKLIPLVIVNALDGKSLPVYGDGSNIRDWLYVEDHVRGIDLVIKEGSVGRTYNICRNEEWTNIDIVRTLFEALNRVFDSEPGLRKQIPNAPAAKGKPSASLITFIKDRPGHDWRYAIDASLIRNELRFNPQYDFSTGLQRTISWMLEEEPWWRAMMDRSYRKWVARHYGDD
jgi:dTDP-glucose 4,6-dehydratase